LLREIGRTYLVLDALDECSEELGQLMDLILRLREWDESPLHLLFTSQPWTEFIDGFKDVTSICLDSSVTERDIKLFVDKELRENRKMKTWAPHTDEISKRVVSQSGGMSVCCRLTWMIYFIHTHAQVPLSCVFPRRTFTPNVDR
jgi:hypothetical protein